MKRLVLCVLALLLLFLCKGEETDLNRVEQPFSFYYRSAETSFDSEQGLICPYIRDLGRETLSVQELFELYMQDPEEDALKLPFSKTVRLDSASRKQDLIELRFNEAYLSAPAVDISIADACVAKTAFEIETISRVHILVIDDDGNRLKDSYYKKNDIMLFDDGKESGTKELTLYFTDAAGRYLLADRRAFPYSDESLMPNYIVEQLIEGPKSPPLYRTLPEGTALLDINVDNGTCIVDFNGDFYKNRPTTERGEQLALLSVVNSLCALDEIDQVQFYIEGDTQATYNYLNISEPFTADSTAIGPIRADLNEFDGTLYLPSQDGDILLHQLFVRCRITGSQTKEEAIIHALLTRASKNGLINLLSSDTISASVTVENGICSVDFSDNPFPNDSVQAETAALRSVVATLKELPGVNLVRLSVRGAPIQFTFLDPFEFFLPAQDWYCTGL